MNTKYEYPSEGSLTNGSYLKNSKAIGVLWGVFSICFAIINVVVFVQPHWLGDTPESKGTGYFGLWQACRLVQDGQNVVCEGRLNDFSSIPSPAFKVATVFVGLSVLIILLSICAMLLFFVFHSSTVFHICGWLQMFGAISLVIGVLVFPAGWDSDVVREVCGHEADDYNPGQCGIRWAFILAIIGVCDCIVLASLAFVLGTRYVKLLPEQYITNGSLYKAEVNTAFVPDTQSITSRKSMTLQPVMVVSSPPVDPERFSEYSHRTLTNSRQEFNRNFQL